MHSVAELATLMWGSGVATAVLGSNQPTSARTENGAASRCLMQSMLLVSGGGAAVVPPVLCGKRQRREKKPAAIQPSLGTCLCCRAVVRRRVHSRQDPTGGVAGA